MLFSKRHYVWLASHFRDELNCGASKKEEQEIVCQIKHLAKSLKSENPDGFDIELFYKNIFNPCEIKTHEELKKEILEDCNSNLWA